MVDLNLQEIKVLVEALGSLLAEDALKDITSSILAVSLLGSEKAKENEAERKRERAKDIARIALLRDAELLKAKLTILKIGLEGEEIRKLKKGK